VNTQVDLTELAVARDAPPTGPRRHVGSRYVLPAALLIGFAALVVWAARDRLFPPLEVRVVPVLAQRSVAQPAGTPLFQAAGWVEPRPTPVRVAALAPGVVDALLVVEDQAVKAGEPIARLVDDDAQLDLQLAEAHLRLQTAELQQTAAAVLAARTRLERPVHMQAALAESEGALAEVEALQHRLPFDIRQAESELASARADYEAKRRAGNAIPELTLARTHNQLLSAQAAVEELRGQVGALEKQHAALVDRRDALQQLLEMKTDEQQALGEAEARRDAAIAQRDQAQVQLAQAKLRVDRMTVRSPVDGRVLELTATPGTRFGRAGEGPTRDGSTVVTLYRPESLQVRVDVRLEDIRQARPGLAVLINSPAVESPLAGNVLLIGSQADMQKNTLEVKVTIDAPPPVLKPDMLVEVTFLADGGDTALDEPSETLRVYVPRQLVQHDDGGSSVWVADLAAATARRTAVQTGDAAGPLTEITDGLTPASRLIAAPPPTLRDGQRIRVVGEAEVE